MYTYPEINPSNQSSQDSKMDLLNQEGKTDRTLNVNDYLEGRLHATEKELGDISMINT